MQRSNGKRATRSDESSQSGAEMANRTRERNGVLQSADVEKVKTGATTRNERIMRAVEVVGDVCNELYGNETKPSGKRRSGSRLGR